MKNIISLPRQKVVLNEEVTDLKTSLPMKQAAKIKHLSEEVIDLKKNMSRHKATKRLRTLK